MWRSRKLIVGVVLAAVLLLGSLGGIALAQENESDNADSNLPRVEFLERLAEKLGISVQELQDAIAQIREELPVRNGGMWQGRQWPADHFGNLGERLGIEIDEDAWKAAMAEARERIQAGDDRQEIMAEVLESFGIDVEELKATCAGDADGGRLFKHGFRSMGGMRSFGGPFAPAE